MARSGGEAQRLVQQGGVWVGGCIPPCNARMSPFKCTCNGWHKSLNPTENISAGTVLRLGDGSWRLLIRKGSSAFDQLCGIGHVPVDIGSKILMEDTDKFGTIAEWDAQTRRYTIQMNDETWQNVDDSHFLIVKPKNNV